MASSAPRLQLRRLTHREKRDRRDCCISDSATAFHLLSLSLLRLITRLYLPYSSQISVILLQVCRHINTDLHMWFEDDELKEQLRRHGIHGDEAIDIEADLFEEVLRSTDSAVVSATSSPSTSSTPPGTLIHDNSPGISTASTPSLTTTSSAFSDPGTPSSPSTPSSEPHDHSNSVLGATSAHSGLHQVPMSSIASGPAQPYEGATEMPYHPPSGYNIQVTEQTSLEGPHEPYYPPPPYPPPGYAPLPSLVNSHPSPQTGIMPSSVAAHTQANAASRKQASRLPKKRTTQKRGKPSRPQTGSRTPGPKAKGRCRMSDTCTACFEGTKNDWARHFRLCHPECKIKKGPQAAGSGAHVQGGGKAHVGGGGAQRAKKEKEWRCTWKKDGLGLPCVETFADIPAMGRHVISHHFEVKGQCPKCGVILSRQEGWLNNTRHKCKAGLGAVQGAGPST